jgi:hypothetical protein
MGNLPSSGGYILTVIFVSMVALFGMLTLFVRAMNIERNALVGTLTFMTAAISGIVLATADNLSNAALISLCALSLVGFAVGRFIDYVLGAREHSADSREATLGADLAD